MNTVRFYDPDTKAIAEMPIAELAPGCIACQVEGIEGTVYTFTDKLRPNPEYAQPPFPDE